jgi:hypothetical protein
MDAVDDAPSQTCSFNFAEEFAMYDQDFVMPITVEEYVKGSVEAFLNDPPDTDYQRGFLAAMLVLAKEALGLRTDLHPFAKAKELVGKEDVVE